MKYLAILFLVGCSIPSVDDIALSDCLAICSATRDVCRGDVRAKLDKCDDLMCYKTLAIQEDSCWANYTDCAQACIAEVEHKLKE